MQKNACEIRVNFKNKHKQNYHSNQMLKLEISNKIKNFNRKPKKKDKINDIYSGGASKTLKLSHENIEKNL